MHRHAGGDPRAGRGVDGAAALAPRVRLQPAAQRRRAHPQRVGIDVDEDRAGAGIADRVAGGDEGERLGDDLVATLDPGDDQRGVERGAAVDGGDAVCGAGEGRDRRLELGDAGTDRGDEIRIDAVDRIGPLIAFEDRAVERDRAGAVDIPDRVDESSEHDGEEAGFMSGIPVR